jgi:hypothetical protein
MRGQQHRRPDPIFLEPFSVVIFEDSGPISSLMRLLPWTTSGRHSRTSQVANPRSI